MVIRCKFSQLCQSSGVFQLLVIQKLVRISCSSVLPSLVGQSSVTKPRSQQYSFVACVNCVCRAFSLLWKACERYSFLISCKNAQDILFLQLGEEIIITAMQYALQHMSPKWNPQMVIRHSMRVAFFNYVECVTIQQGIAISVLLCC